MEAFANSQIAIEEIYAERRYQADIAGCTLEHDDEHDNGEIGAAASAWAHPQQLVMAWGAALDKRSETRRRQLIIAAALIVAEIERLDRAEAKAADHG
jgi:hypothetical protein